MNTFELVATAQHVSKYEEQIVQRKIVSIPFRNLVLAAYLYMVIPILIFFLAWLMVYWYSYGWYDYNCTIFSEKKGIYR